MTEPATGRSLGESDWDDEDLLTIAEASERLAEEIRLARERGDSARAQELIAAAERISKTTGRA